MNYDQAKIIAKAIGFTHIIRCVGKKSILDVYRSQTSKISGCYLQFRSEGIFYIGQSKHIPNRYSAHLSHGHAIEFLAFKPCDPEVLLETETELIQRAEALGYPLANRRKREKLTETPDFDEVVPPYVQDAFLMRFNTEILFSSRIERLTREAGESHRADWLAFKRLPKARTILDIVSRYLRTILPADDLAGVFYRITLGYRQNNTSFQPALRITFGVHTLLTVGFLRRLPNFPYAVVTLATRPLLANGSKENFHKEFPWLSVRWDVVRSDLPFSPAHRKVIYPSPQAREEDTSREVSRALSEGFSEVTLPLEMLYDLLLEPRFAKASALAAMASMRWSKLTNDEHNLLASFAIETGYWP